MPHSIRTCNFAAQRSRGVADIYPIKLDTTTDPWQITINDRKYDYTGGPWGPNLETIGQFIVTMISYTESLDYSQIFRFSDWKRMSINPCSEIPMSVKHYLTWMPYHSYEKNANCFLDPDLKMMCVRALRTLKSLETTTYTNIKSVEMWRNYEQSLIQYGIILAHEYVKRGYSSKPLDIFVSKFKPAIYPKPDWVYWKELQKSHQSYLLLRDYRRLVLKGLPRTESIVRSCVIWGVPQKRKWSIGDINHLRTTYQYDKPLLSRYQGNVDWALTPIERLVWPEKNTNV